MESGGFAETVLLGSQVAPQGSAGLGAEAGGDRGGADGGRPQSEAGARVAGAVLRGGRGRPRKYGVRRGAMRSASSSRGLARRGSASRGRGRRRGPSSRVLHVPPVDLFCEVGGPPPEFAGIFEAHVVTLHRGEEILAKLSDLIEPGSRSLSILSAAGSVSSVVVRQLGPPSGLLTYEGYFEIMSLNGSFTIREGRIGTRPEDSIVSVTLARLDGQVFGGGVAGPLTVAEPTQIVVGIFKDAVRNEPMRVESTNPDASAAIGVSANPLHGVRQPEPIARTAEVDENSGTPASVLLEPTDMEARTTVTSGNDDVNPASLRVDEHYPLGPVEPMLDRNMFSTDTDANVPEL